LPLTMISFSGVFLGLGFVFASFVFWRGLRKEYPEEEILTLTLVTALASMLGARLFFVLLHSEQFLEEPLRIFFWLRFPGLSFLGAFLFGLLTLIFWSRRKSWDPWVVVEAAVLPFLFLFIVGCLGAFIESSKWRFLAQVGIGLAVELESKLLAGYRSYAWYKSGKVGFLFLSLLTTFFTLLLALAFFSRNTLYWENLGYLIIVFGGLLFLYRRSERSFKEDLWAILLPFRRKS